MMSAEENQPDWSQIARYFIQDDRLTIPHEYLLVNGNKRS